MDTILFDDTGMPVAAYGPRVDIDGHVEPPSLGRAAEFWGVYEREGDRWKHVIDLESGADAKRIADLVLRADGSNYDPTDLAALAAGWAGSTEASPGVSLTLEDAVFLCDVARLLHRLWKELPEDALSGVWAYEVAEPTGHALGQRGGHNLQAAEEIARAFIAEELRHDEQASKSEATPQRA